MNENKKFNLSEVAGYIGNKKIGRTILYRILRELNVVDETNRPYPKYINNGNVCIGQPKYVSNGRLMYVTLAVGLNGMDFIGRVVLFYLKDHPIPKVKRKPKI